MEEKEVNVNNEENLEALKSKIAELEKINSKQKESLDKASSDVAAYKKKEREHSENENQTKTQNEELLARIETLEKEKREAKFASNMAKGGMDEKTINKLMESYFTNDAEAFSLDLVEVIKNVKEEALKENTLDKLTSTKRPEHSDNTEPLITREKFAKMGYQAACKLAAENPALYAELTK